MGGRARHEQAGALEQFHGSPINGKEWTSSSWANTGGFGAGLESPPNGVWQPRFAVSCGVVVGDVEWMVGLGLRRGEP